MSTDVYDPDRPVGRRRDRRARDGPAGLDAAAAEWCVTRLPAPEAVFRRLARASHSSQLVDSVSPDVELAAVESGVLPRSTLRDVGMSR